MRGLFVVGAAALMLAACGPQAATPEKAEAVRAPIEVAEPGTETAKTETPMVDGKPMWSSNRNQTAAENAQESFSKNGSDFGADNVDAFVQSAHDFTGNPPKGAETFKRGNGDTLIYDAKSNTFAVVTKDGAPRTMFKPREGAAYWAEQKEREAARKAKG